MTHRPAARSLLLALLGAGCAGAPGSPGPALSDATPLHDAVQRLSSVIVYDIVSPPQASRIYAYASVAAYEVARQGDPGLRPLAGQLRGLTPVPVTGPDDSVSLALGAVHAYLTVGRALTFSQARMDTLRAQLDSALGAGMTRARYEATLAYGERVAAHVLQWAGGDGFKQSRGMPKYSVSRAPGRWIPTPPAYMDAVEPNWGTLRPLVLDSTAQFRAAPPHPFSTDRGSPFMREVREVYDTSRALTDEQRAIAAFWDCNPYVMHVQGHTMFATKKISPGGHWMGIVGGVARQARLDLPRTAEAYARTAIALFDGFLTVWESKYAYTLVRPETVINATLDERWVPLLQTPPFPEYTSGHSVISTASAMVLTALLGDHFAFADSSEVAYGLPVRAYGSFLEASREAARSRLYGGIHFRRAIEEGQRQGRLVGETIVARVQTRVEDAGAAPATPSPAGVARAGAAAGRRPAGGRPVGG